ncbi:Phenylacetate-coenzyme A ligase [bacterium HR40]|nr:Phenylacetate-coenzyme A ligase [bacterium HR40]
MPESGNVYYDRQEVRPHAERVRSLFHALPGLLRHALENAPLYRRRLGDIDPEAVTDHAALARLPVLRKSELLALQEEDPPFGGLAATPLSRLAHVFQSPGPIYEPHGVRADYWRMARALFAAGFRRGDLVHNAFSYHMTPAGEMLDAGARALGCPVFPAGTGQTELQIEAIQRLKPQGYTGTPSFLKILLESAAAKGRGPLSFTKALVSGEAFPPSLRDRLRSDHGIDGYQCYATAECGLIAYETSAREGLVVDEAVLLEIVRPGTDEPLPEGEVGEVVVTVFNPDYPLIRFGTGDLSAILPGPSPCGRTNLRIRGWMGRADQTTKVRGMFVHPKQVAEIARRFPELGRVRLVVRSEEGRDQMVLRAECPAPQAEGLAERIAEAIRAVTGLRGEVELVPVGSLPNDGRVIADERPVP